MDYPLKTVSQLRPMLLGFRRKAGLTQEKLAQRLGISQQSYAAFEANPAAASVDRLFRVLRLLAVDMRLATGVAQAEPEAKRAGAVSPSKRKRTSVPVASVTTTKKPVAKKAAVKKTAAKKTADKAVAKKRSAVTTASQRAPAKKAPKQAAPRKATPSKAAPRKAAASPSRREDW
ncbi:helix-turn-helix transcriptional regulator [Paraburkholderia sp. J67]|uniref:helix-turn-helix transcriptional regulator n=1 Tax=Paraburkholderia sp. J67 TaxID=2805435 RepID=UPI002ABD233D|nr:helix-turn-helix transcriptional regulator [Paraburkholderia sp. J67]